MNNILIALGLGIGAGIVDIIPMIIKRLDRYSILSAFMQWVFLGVIIRYSSIFGLTGWANGVVAALLGAIPIVLLVVKEDKNAPRIILGTSVVLGGIVGFVSSCV